MWEEPDSSTRHEGALDPLDGSAPPSLGDTEREMAGSIIPGATLAPQQSDARTAQGRAPVHREARGPGEGTQAGCGDLGRDGGERQGTWGGTAGRGLGTQGGAGDLGRDGGVRCGDPGRDGREGQGTWGGDAGDAAAAAPHSLPPRQPSNSGGSRM